MPTPPKVYQSLSNILNAISPILKDQQGHGYKFRGIDQVLNAFHPLFKINKLIIVRSEIETTREVREVEKTSPDGKKTYKKYYVDSSFKATYHLTSLEDGSQITTGGYGEGQDASGGDSSAMIAQANAFKRILLELFCVPTEEIKDSDMHKVLEVEKQVTIEKAQAREAIKPAPKEADLKQIETLLLSGKRKEAETFANKFDIDDKTRATIKQRVAEAKGKKAVEAARQKAS
ncbi:MAG TPA: hypothetical protein DCG19_03865 [Cryomorphaceae bacterium]|nr:hypothetical protein [Owenweeksia sp.]MBF97871.1 hypothetical protein [Owenweeksia sp.]HAD96516.1 hypothetical protein [Cryomorphaceae bacterium]HCQ17131.1 hypothetical protein [Cryomorphaceae bacterium]|tara:strand:- start:634 stop:1329 length:696 start_codon:yes stop_codon:yes gene_type:complete